MVIDEKTPILTFEKPAEFSHWLAKHHLDTPAVWIRMFKKASGKISINYDQALDEALCFGWIDGIVKSYDSESYVQRFTPRRPKGNWSKRNTGHIARLIKEGKMQPSGMAEVEKAKADGRWDAAYDSPVNSKIPDEFLKEIAKNKKAQANFEILSKTNIFAISYRLQTAKKTRDFGEAKKSDFRNAGKR